MIRSSRAERPPLFSGWAKSSSSARSSSRSISPITHVVLEAYKGGGTFGHPSLPSILRTDRREPSPLLLEPISSHGKLLGLLRCQARALGGDSRRHLLQPILTHGLGKDSIRFPEGI